MNVNVNGCNESLENILEEADIVYLDLQYKKHKSDNVASNVAIYIPDNKSERSFVEFAVNADNTAHSPDIEYTADVTLSADSIKKLVRVSSKTAFTIMWKWKTLQRTREDLCHILSSIGTDFDCVNLFISNNYEAERKVCG